MLLSIRPNGGKYWRLKYRFARKEKTLSFGFYPEVSLKEARDKKVDLLHRVLQTCGQIFRYGVARRRVDRNISIDLRGALKRRMKKL